ncbi:TSUP family transporter [Verminephrobacter aporrectodeae]|uniref:TSUP family transporter n=2 Tax=Verminephrobacter aporrectodeae TaxID=1110389 RepID=UPI002243D19F|nr:TSUP family transporter [Verminephrobacter aporrectodeae]
METEALNEILRGDSASAIRFMDMISFLAGEHSLFILCILAGVAFLAGAFDAIAGGGGLVTVPALVIAGLDPVSAIATSKLQATLGAISATKNFARAGLIEWERIWPATVLACLGSIMGALVVSSVPQQLVKTGLPFLLIIMALYFALSPKMTDDDAEQRVSMAAFCATAAVVIGFYDGAFGPGTGSFFMIAFVLLLGYGVVRATAHTKLLNLASILGSLSIYVFQGLVHWRIGVVMGLGAFIGAQVGSKLAIRVGAKLIRPLLMVVCCAIAFKLMLDPMHPVYRWIAGSI